MMENVAEVKKQVNDLLDHNPLKASDIHKIRMTAKSKDKKTTIVRTYVTLVFGPKKKA